MSHPQHQIISRIPQRGMNAEQWGLVVENALIKIWVDAMSAAERKGFEEGGLGNVSAASFAKLDEIILHQAETLGWRIRLSKLVQFRQSEWDQEKAGPEKFRRMGMAEAKLARIVQRRELPPIEDPDQWLVKQETVEELRIVLQNLRATFAVQRKGLTPNEAHKLFSVAVSESPESFRHLASNLERWLRFFHENPDTLRPMAVGDRAKPGMLYDEFLAW